MNKQGVNNKFKKEICNEIIYQAEFQAVDKQVNMCLFQICRALS